MNDLAKRTQLDRDKAALTNPQSAEQVMEIGKRASALHKVYKTMKGYEEDYYKAFEVMIEAYRIVGVELRQMDKATGGWPNLEVPDGDRKITLAELGITKKQSSEWQSIALVPLIDIEEYTKARRAESESATKSDILRIAENYKSAQQIYDEEVDRVIATMNAFIIQARRVVIHRQKFSDIGMVTKKDLFETSDLCGKILDELNRATM